MYNFWYEYREEEYCRAQFCYIDTHSFIFYIKTKDMKYLSYEVERLLPTRKNKKCCCDER